jgi:hypothetical protein
VRIRTAPSSPRQGANASAAGPAFTAVIAVMLGGCAGGPAFVTADYAKCRELGFVEGSRDYEMCLTEVQRQRTTLAAAPQPATE